MSFYSQRPFCSCKRTETESIQSSAWDINNFKWRAQLTSVTRIPKAKRGVASSRKDGPQRREIWLGGESIPGIWTWEIRAQRKSGMEDRNKPSWRVLLAHTVWNPLSRKWGRGRVQARQGPKCPVGWWGWTLSHQQLATEGDNCWLTAQPLYNSPGFQETRRIQRGKPILKLSSWISTQAPKTSMR